MKRVLSFIFKIFLLAILLFIKEGMLEKFILHRIFYSSFFISLINFLIFWLSINILIKFAQFIYRKRKKYGDKYSDNVIIGLHNIYYILSFIGVVTMVIGFFGVEFIKLLTALSIVAAALAIISKELVMDVICGINLSFSREIAIGDFVRIGDKKGRVVDINISKIVLHNEDDDIIYITNSKAHFEDVVNYTQKEIRKYTIEFSFGRDRFILKDDLLDILKKELISYQPYLEDMPESLKIISIGKDEIRYKFQFKLNQVNPYIAEEIKSRLMHVILNKIHGLSTDYS
ncbi:MAG: mechanosensitive ion channel family protein [Bacteroidota bacterium]|nr:mechanosensitive ion channel family protein [Bacteroidota bacterium]